MQTTAYIDYRDREQVNYRDQSYEVALGDFNNDGRLDAPVGGEAALPDGMSVFNGNGDGTFQPSLQQRFSTGGTDPLAAAGAGFAGLALGLWTK